MTRTVTDLITRAEALIASLTYDDSGSARTPPCEAAVATVEAR